jgi:hypothetical protein
MAHPVFPKLVQVERWELYWKVHKVPRLPIAQVPSRVMPIQWKSFSISSFQANGLVEGVLSHGLPGHRIWPVYISFYGVHKGLGVPNGGARCGRTASQNNCSLWDIDAGKHLARGGVSCGHPSGHRGRTTGDLLRSIKTWELSAFFNAVSMFLCILV